MQIRPLPCLLAISVLGLGGFPPADLLPSAAQKDSSKPRRVILISFDAAADWIVDRMIARGQAPAFARMAETGAAAESMVTVIPSLTAVAHATLWTGAYPRQHGVTDNNMPRTPSAAHTLLQRQSGFLSPVLRAEPIWITAARAGKRALVMQATGGFPFSARFPERLVQFDAYGDDLLTAEIVEGTLQADRFVFRIGDTDAVVRRAGPRAVSLAVGDSEVDLSLDGRYSPVVRVTVRGRQGLVRVGLLAFDSESGRLLLARGDVVIVSSTHPELIPVLVAEAGVPLGEGAGTPYKRGRFGPTMADGGEGEAERGLIRAVVANHEYFDGVLRFAAGQPWDLLVLYVSSLDTTGHALVGMLDPDTPEHDPQLAERIWPVYEELFRRCADDYVAELRRRFPDAALVIGADHGMEGIRWRWHPNAVLRQAGLLHEDADGHVDLARTSALFLSSHAGGVYINSVRYQGGIVHDHERPALKRQITNALLSARDPVTGSPLVRSVVDTDLDGEALGIGGDLSPDLYFDPYPGYVASAAFGARELVVPLPPTRDGAHGPFPTRRRLHAIFYAAGPGIGAGVRPGLVRAVDVAPTVSRLLDIPPPADSVGRALPLDR